MSSAFFDRVASALQPRYRLDATLGSGGMAVVFRAFDTALERDVAVKVLRPELATAVNAERFGRESRRLARLSDPHLVAVHDAGERDGVLYYVMDLVEAETLRQRLERGPLDTESGLRVARGLLRALATVHAAGLVHRDVKPENVFLKEGEPLLTDFGISKSLDTTVGESLTRAGGSPGTPAYMPPEQAQGADVGPAADLYAVGMILFECLTGRRWPSGFRPRSVEWGGVPTTIRPVLERTLALRPDRRWRDAEHFRAALGVARRSPWLARRGVRVTLGGTILVLLGGVGWLLWGAGGQTGGPSIRWLAVRPCEDAELEEQYPKLGDALADLTRDRLGERGFRVSASYSLATISPDAGPLEIGSRLPGVEGVVGCEVRRQGEGIRMSATLSDTRRGDVIWTDELAAPDGGFLELPERVASAIARAVDLRSAGASRPSTGTRDIDPRARTAWAAGLSAWRERTEDRTSLLRAERHYRAALEREPSFGPALAGLAEVYVTLSARGLAAPDSAFPLAVEFADSAIALGWDVAASYAARGEAFRAYFRGRWAEAGAAFEAGIQRDSSWVPTHLWYAFWLASEGEYERAIERARWARALDPYYPDVNTGLGIVLYLADRSDGAVAQLDRTVESNPDSWEAGMWLAAALIADGRVGDARDRLEAVGPRIPADLYPFVSPMLAAGYAATGDVARAGRLLASASPAASPFWTAVALANLGEPQRALARLEEAWTVRDEFLSYVGVLPLLDEFRRTEEYRRFVREHDMPWFTGS